MPPTRVDGISNVCFTSRKQLQPAVAPRCAAGLCGGFVEDNDFQLPWPDVFSGESLIGKEDGVRVAADGADGSQKMRAGG